MQIRLKTPQEIEKMRRAGRVVREALNACREMCREGVTTAEIDAVAEQVLDKHGAVGLFKWYPTYEPGKGFPAVTCISVNEEVVHGIPGDRKIQAGDIVSIDCGANLDGWCGDSAITFMVEPITTRVRKLCEDTQHVLQIAIENIRPGRTWSQVAGLMESYAERQNYGIVREFVGHGIGQKMHEDPKLPNFVSSELRRRDISLKPGMVLAVEPMCTLGQDRVKVLDDQWTVVTADRQPAAHYEHTIAVTEDGCSVLTDGN